jgi:hypothetical protein
VKEGKERITIALLVSLTGEKFKPIIIGKAATPRCFAKISKKDFHYFSSKNSWMDSIIFNSYLRLINSQFSSNNR